MDLQMQLEDEGCVVIGPAAHVTRALDVLSTERPDAATLDVNLNGTTSAAVARALTEMGVPFVVTTGYSGIPAELALGEATVVRKPVDMADLVQKLAELFE